MGIFRRDSGGTHHEPLETVVGPSASLNGHLRSDGGVRIDGTFEGVIEVAGNVVIGEGARVVADIAARNITVAGAFKGNIDGTGRLEILSTGEVYGDIMVAAVMIDEGGMFQGSSRMRGLEQRALAPPPAEVALEMEDAVVVDVRLDDDAVDVTSRPAAFIDDTDDDLSDLDFGDIEPVIPDVVIEDVSESNAARDDTSLQAGGFPTSKRSRRRSKK